MSFRYKYIRLISFNIKVALANIQVGGGNSIQ
jgi:hypothetical protein